MEMFPCELYTSANTERERERKRKYHFYQPMFLKQKGTERKRNETKEERKKCFLGNYMLLRIEREKKYYFPRTRNF